MIHEIEFCSNDSVYCLKVDYEIDPGEPMIWGTRPEDGSPGYGPSIAEVYEMVLVEYDEDGNECNSQVIGYDDPLPEGCPNWEEECVEHWVAQGGDSYGEAECFQRDCREDESW